MTGNTFILPKALGKTYGMLSSVGFSGVDLLFVSLWLHNPRFVELCSLSGPF